MNKKSLIISIIASVLLLAGIAVAVVFLYKGETGQRQSCVNTDVEAHYPLLQAIPSDALAVLCLDNVRDGVSLLTDDTKLFSSLVSDPKNETYSAFLDTVSNGIDAGKLAAIKSRPMALSLHYNGSVVPLLILGVAPASTDSTLQVVSLRNAASDCGLSSGFFASGDECMVLVSSSETVVNSSMRHQDEGLSILASKDFSACLSGASGRNALFLSNAQASKVFPAFFKKPLARHAAFFKTVALWTVLSFDKIDDKNLTAKGFLSSGNRSDSFSSVLSGQSGDVPAFFGAVPSGSDFAFSLTMSDPTSYRNSYNKYLDALTKLSSRQSTISQLKKSSSKDPEEWAKSLGIKEVAKAEWRSGDIVHQALFVRAGHKGIPSQPEPYAGFLQALFGDAFSLSDESSVASVGEWIVSGSEEAVADWKERYAAGDVLSALLSDAGIATPSKEASLTAYFSAGALNAEDLFSPTMLKSLTSTLDGAAFEPFILSCAGESFQLDVVRVPFINKTSTPAVVSDAAVEIPQGPFEVKNSGTGKTNLLAQQSNYYLSLKEKDGAGIWSIPFSEPLCGVVETIDYYANGKLQFLFAAGSKLYLLDRLGRFVSGFPVELGKEVLLGPAAYDFTGAKGYSVLVLHKDNTIEMYNIHGAKPEEWKGIATDEKIIALPELVKIGSKSYWAVRTAVQTQIFPFYGGDPVYRQEGSKSIRRDSAIEVYESSLKVTCNDGKERNIKLQ